MISDQNEATESNETEILENENNKEEDNLSDGDDNASDVEVAKTKTLRQIVEEDSSGLDDDDLDLIDQNLGEY